MFSFQIYENLFTWHYVCSLASLLCCSVYFLHFVFCVHIGLQRARLLQLKIRNMLREGRNGHQYQLSGLPLSCLAMGTDPQKLFQGLCASLTSVVSYQLSGLPLSCLAMGTDPQKLFQGLCASLTSVVSYQLQGYRCRV